jgi:hypothetical protein
MVQMLLEAGDAPTPGLYEASYGGYSEILRLLVAPGRQAECNLNTRFGVALVAACKGGHLELMNILLDAGTDPLACRGKCMKQACSSGNLFQAHSTYARLI